MYIEITYDDYNIKGGFYISLEVSVLMDLKIMYAAIPRATSLLPIYKLYKNTVKIMIK